MMNLTLTLQNLQLSPEPRHIHVIKIMRGSAATPLPALHHRTAFTVFPPVQLRQHEVSNPLPMTFIWRSHREARQCRLVWTGQ